MTRFPISNGRFPCETQTDDIPGDSLTSRFPFRCIKPNDKKAAHIFSEALVCHQIRYLGLLENVRVRRAGYAFRQAYEPCLERYKMLCKQTWPHWRGPAR